MKFFKLLWSYFSPLRCHYSDMTSCTGHNLSKIHSTSIISDNSTTQQSNQNATSDMVSGQISKKRPILNWLCQQSADQKKIHLTHYLTVIKYLQNQVVKLPIQNMGISSTWFQPLVASNVSISSHIDENNPPPSNFWLLTAVINHRMIEGQQRKVRSCRCCLKCVRHKVCAVNSCYTST